MYERVRKKPSKERKVYNSRIIELYRLKLVLKEITSEKETKQVYERRVLGK